MSELTPRYGIVGLVIHWPKAGRPDASVRAFDTRYRREEAAEIEAEAYHAALLSSGSDSDFLAATFVFEDGPTGRRLVSLRTSPNPDPFADLVPATAADLSADPLTPADEARLRDEELLDGIDEDAVDPSEPAPLAADPGDDLGQVGAVAAELVSALDLATVPDGELR